MVRKLAYVRPGEGRAVFWAALYYFSVLLAYYALRPLRETMGIEGGPDKLPWLFTATLVGTLVVTPLFSALVARWPRARFLPFVYRASNAQLVCFLVLFLVAPSVGAAGEEAGLAGLRVEHVGRVFYVWLSIFNLFAVAVFGGFMADLFDLEQGKRLFGLIALGGTLGAMAGSGLAGILARHMDPVLLIGLAMAFLELAVLCIRRLVACAPDVRASARARDADLPGVVTGAPNAESVGARQGAAAAQAAPDGAVGGSWYSGILLALGSPFLIAITLFMFLQAAVQTVFYFEQAEVVNAAIVDRGLRTAWFSRLDFAVNAATLVMQLLVTGRILRRFGLGLTLMALPLISAVGFALLARSPGLAVMFLSQLAFRAGNFAATKPAREALYTVVDREAKYKSKNFIDVFVRRGGDALAAWSFDALRGGKGASGGEPAPRLSAAEIARWSVVLCALWLAVAAYLGRRQRQLADDRGDASATRPAVE